MLKRNYIDRSRWLVVLTVMLGTFTVSLNNSALNPALPEFISVFSIGPTSASWIISSFMISMGMTMPLTGYLSQRFGNKVMYLSGLAIFLVGSIVGMLANSILSVIIARCIQGVASGLMIPLSLVLIFSVYNKDERGSITAIWGSVVMLAPAIGPIIGALLLEFSSWRVLFAMNIPIGVIGIFIGFRALIPDKNKVIPVFDWLGFFLIFTGLGLLMFVLSNLNSSRFLNYTTKLILLGISIFALIFFIKVELKKKTPLLNLRLFFNQSYYLSIIIVVTQSVGMFGCLVLIPMLVQVVLGYSPIWTGVALLTTSVSASFFVKLSGKYLDYQGAKYIVFIGIFLTGVATFCLGGLANSTSLIVLNLLMILRGIGIGLSYIPATTAGLNSIPESLVAQGSAINNILRRTISSIGVIVVAFYIEIRTQGLTERGTVDILANQIAISEAFRAIGFLILCVLPFAYIFPKKDKGIHKIDT